jgi:ABC-type sulfate transport system substrate-binding protein
VSDTIRCPECESKQIGALEADEDTVRKEIRKAKNKKLLDEAKNSAELISTYGRAALVTLAGKGLKLGDAIVILDKESEVNEHLIELIIESEKAVLKRRFFRYRKEKK